MPKRISFETSSQEAKRFQIHYDADDEYEESILSFDSDDSIIEVYDLEFESEAFAPIIDLAIENIERAECECSDCMIRFQVLVIFSFNFFFLI